MMGEKGGVCRGGLDLLEEENEHVSMWEGRRGGGRVGEGGVRRRCGGHSSSELLLSRE